MPDSDGRRKLTAYLLDFLQTIVLALALFMISYLFLFQPHKVEGHSMDPNFADGEYILTEKLSYRFGDPKRGDVVIFESPINRRQDLIKRVIATPGEQITVKNGKIYIDNEPLLENYLPQNFATDPGVFLTNDLSLTLNSDEYIVFGDNRSNSSDSRTFGPIKRKDLIGKVWIIYWPPKAIGPIKNVSYNSIQENSGF